MEFLKPANGADSVAFDYPFALEGKAVDGGTGDVVHELEDGDLLISGWAAEFDDVDRESEGFMPGAFKRGIKAFLESNSPTLCYQHQHSDVLGRVLELEEVEGKGLKMVARVDGAIKGHPTLGTIYNQIRRGTLTALSVGGYFRRVMSPEGWRIGEVDFVEISVAGTPVSTAPRFSVIGGKALSSMGKQDEVAEDELDFTALAASLDAFRTTLDGLVSHRTLS